MLREHPDIFFSDPKEPSFFCRPFQVVRDPISYAELFEDAGDATAVGDASHVHFSHPDAARAIRAFFPAARFVLILRNPADRAHSLYCWATIKGYERHGSFEAALKAEDRRANDPTVLDNPFVYAGNLMYFRSGLFGEQLQRYLQHFPISAFHVTTLDRLARQPDATLAGVCEFLGVGPISVTHSLRANPSYGVRSAPLQWLARSAHGQLNRWGVPGTEKALRLVQRYNRRPEPIPMRESTRSELLERYCEDLKLLRRLTGVDLSE